MTWIERLPDRIRESPDGCHIWLRARNNRGYGVTWFDGKLRLAHRVAWFHLSGRWPVDGLVLDHLCNRKECVNAVHLAEVTNSQNLLRAVTRGDAKVEAQRASWRASQRASRSRRAAS